MKKYNFYFLGECVIILGLLVVIAFLIKDDKHTVIGRESVVEEAVQEMTEEFEGDQEGQVVVQSQPKDVAKVKKEEDNRSKEEDGIVSVQEKIASENQIKIVVFGDSIWNADRGENGISEQVMEATGVKIYNCAIGGTTAAVKGESTAWDEWTSKSFNGMMYIANDVLSADELIGNDEAYNVIREVDFEDVDYVIVSYGLNDYFCDVSIYPKEYYEITNYVGALRNGITKLKKGQVIGDNSANPDDLNTNFPEGAFIKSSIEISIKNTDTQRMWMVGKIDSLDIVYVDGTNGYDNNLGETADAPLKTIETAYYYLKIFELRQLCLLYS